MNGFDFAVADQLIDLSGGLVLIIDDELLKSDNFSIAIDDELVQPGNLDFALASQSRKM